MDETQSAGGNSTKPHHPPRNVTEVEGEVLKAFNHTEGEHPKPPKKNSTTETTELAQKKARAQLRNRAQVSYDYKHCSKYDLPKELINHNGEVDWNLAFGYSWRENYYTGEYVSGEMTDMLSWMDELSGYSQGFLGRFLNTTCFEDLVDLTYQFEDFFFGTLFPQLNYEWIYNWDFDRWYNIQDKVYWGEDLYSGNDTTTDYSYDTSYDYSYDFNYDYTGGMEVDHRYQNLSMTLWSYFDFNTFSLDHEKLGADTEKWFNEEYAPVTGAAYF